MENGIIGSSLMCHAPIVIPRIAGPRASDVSQSTQAMQKVAQDIVKLKPDLLIVISPHTPRPRKAFGLVGGDTIKGNFADFGFPKISVSFPNGKNQIKDRMMIEDLPPFPLDHGAMVPLFFMQEAEWNGPTVVFSLPESASAEQLYKFGKDLGAAATQSKQKWYLLASGDMSHRLMRGAPAGYHPKAHEFDKWVVKHVTRGDFRKVVAVDSELRNLAAEDVIESLEVVFGANDFKSNGVKTISYEGPFGVGYLVSHLYNNEKKNHKLILDLARSSIREKLNGKEIALTPEEKESCEKLGNNAAGVFVTLWKINDEGKELRGCIGRHKRAHTWLAEDIADLAVQSAFHDHRFDALTPQELAQIKIEVSLLGPQEKVVSPKDLDPQKYGVTVISGRKSATLLPQIEGIDSVESQLEVVKQKGGIRAHDPYLTYRYSVDKIGEI